MQPSLSSELLRSNQRGLEVFPMFDQLGAETAHGTVLFRTVSMRHHDRRRKSMAGGGECHRLTKISPGRCDHSPRFGSTSHQLVEVIQRAADLERSNRGVVFVLHPELASHPGIEERPRKLGVGGTTALISAAMDSISASVA
jgi:hypothetical protein